MQASERINYIKKWILDYCKSMPKEAETLVVGISGGIDSSVTSTICALTGKKTIILSMPINQIKEQQNLSLKHENWLKNKFKNVESHLINLDNIFKSFKCDALFMSTHSADGYNCMPEVKRFIDETINSIYNIYPPKDIIKRLINKWKLIDSINENSTVKNKIINRLKNKGFYWDDIQDVIFSLENK